jgi:4-hydroxybenzoate polyprenyltransferase
MSAHAYWELIRGHKPVGSLLLLWPALWGLLFPTSELPTTQLWLIFILGSFVMRALGCVINDLWDYRLDQHVQRTKSRPLCTGAISRVKALTTVLGLGLVALILAALLPPLCWLIAGIGFALTCLYPSLKRFTHFPQVLLGFLFAGIPVLMGFAARQNTLTFTAWSISLVATLWPIAYDTLYAMQDREEDKLINIHSLAIFFGSHVQIITLCLQLLFLVGWLGIGFFLSLSIWYYIGWVMALGITIIQWGIINQDSDAYGRAFFLNAILGGCLFFGLLLTRLY